MTINISRDNSTATLDESDACVEVHVDSDCSPIEGSTSRLRVDIPMSGANLRVVYDPASAERARRTEMLNHMIRLGFKVPRSSTK